MYAENVPKNSPCQLETDGGSDRTTQFRATPRQLRTLLIALVISFGVGVAAGLIADSARSWGLAANIASAAGLSWFFFLYSYLAYAFAYTAFGPQGILGRSLAGRYEYRWEQIANVACRAITSRGVTSYRVILTTSDGGRIQLGAPVSGGLMDDPAFEAKYAQIRGAWQAATGRTGPEADTKPIWTRRRILLTAGLTLQVLAAVIFASVLSVSGPALAAHEGMGTPGVFTAESRNCPQPACTWFGQFVSQTRRQGVVTDGSERYVTLAPGGPFIGRPSVTVPAVDTGAKYTVYPVGGGTAWEASAAALAATSAFVLVLLAAEVAVPLHLSRRQRRRARACSAVRH
jgi:hypothetical protein